MYVAPLERLHRDAHRCGAAETAVQALALVPLHIPPHGRRAVGARNALHEPLLRRLPPRDDGVPLPMLLLRRPRHIALDADEYTVEAAAPQPRAPVYLMLSNAADILPPR